MENNADIPPIELEQEEEFIFREEDVRSTQSLFVQAQVLHTHIDKLLKKLEPLYSLLVSDAKSAIDCFKIFRDSLGLYKLALNEYHKLIDLDPDKKEINRFITQHDHIVSLIKNCWDFDDLQQLWIEHSEFYKRIDSKDAEYARSFIKFFDTANSELDPFLIKIVPISESIQKHKKDFLAFPPNLWKLLSRLSTYCSSVSKLLRRRMEEFGKIQGYFKDGFLPDIKEQFKAIELAELNRENLKSYYGELTDFNFISFRSLIENAPLGSWCTEIFKRKEDFIKFIRQDLLRPVLGMINEEEILKSILARCNVRHILNLRDFAREIHLTRTQQQQRALSRISNNLFLIDNPGIFTPLTEINFIILLENLSQFLNNGENFITFEELLYLESIEHSYKENTNQYKRECKWYCRIVMENIENISETLEELTSIPLAQIDLDTAIKMKRLLMLLGLTQDQLKHNPFFNFKHFQVNLPLVQDHIKELKAVLNKPEILRLFDTQLRLT